MSKTLIYTALLPEAQPLINFLKLKEDNSVRNLSLNFKLFKDEDKKYLLIVSGIGRNNCLKSLDFVYNNYEIKKAINIGIAGCCDSSIKIGTLFCTNKLLPNINFASITTVDAPLQSDENLETLLVDMEAKYFLEISKKYCKDNYCFKVVSDYLDIQIPKKSFVIELIEKCKKQWKDYL
ncbi:nucleoside phosphorylase [Halarcobacter ebronensis]|uniref:Nucleoside phosphorylase n=1 Tax=Halarcobacter ebronensis TaxID=1462615 RepID=A0A4Q0YJ20_9BACT|nr:nucleoside phosphorylase [Halarcobacter ebronensis]RXJ68881.1 nucleoside phosphorylase [Halarcobacter ebronensis]